MTDLRVPLFSFLDSKTNFTIINAMTQFDEPDKYVSFYILSDDAETISTGMREYNSTDDLVDVTYAPMALATIQLDIRGDGSYQEAKNLYFGLQTWQEQLKAVGLYYRSIGSIVPIPNVQNGYVKEGYQFNLFLGYDTSIVNKIQYAEELEWL